MIIDVGRCVYIIGPWHTRPREHTIRIHGDRPANNIYRLEAHANRFLEELELVGLKDH